MYAIGKWLSFYIPASLYKALQDGVITPYLLFGEKILKGVKNGVKAYVEGKASYSYLVSDIKKTMASSRKEQQELIKNARNQIRKYGAKMASKVLLKSVFTSMDGFIIVTYFAIGVKNKYGWRNAWK